VKYDDVIATVKIVDFNETGHSQQQPVLAGFNNPMDPQQLVLHMGPYAANRGGSWTTDGDDDFTVTYESGDPNNGETVRVSGLGFQQDYSDVTSIRAEGGLGNNTVTIDPLVTVPVFLFGSVDPKDPNFGNFASTYQNYMFLSDFTKSQNVLQAGGGNALLVGGQGTDQLVGGSGSNMLIGGDSQVNAPNNETLIGGTGPNHMQAGKAGTNTMIAGPQSGDLLTGGKSFLNVDHFVAGAGADVMIGGAGSNDYSWQQGDGNLIVHGGVGAQANVLAANLLSAGGSFLIHHGAFSPLQIDVNLPGGQGIGHITIIQADNVQKVAVDDNGDGATYTVNDLSGTGVQGVLANGHEGGNAGGGPDAITVNGSALLPNVVDITATPNESDGALYNQQGNVVQQSTAPETDADLKISGNEGPFGGGNVHYIVAASIPKITDTLTVNTGIANDTVSVESTQGAVTPNSSSGNGQPNQGGSVFVNTIAGNNTINVGTENPAQHNGLLDRIQGNLYIDAGSGTQNQLNVDERGAVNGDTLALTADPVTESNGNTFTLVNLYQILRYSGEDLQTPEGGGPIGTNIPPETHRYPMLIQYGVDMGGAFGAGINLYLTSAPDTLYVTDTMPGAQTTIYSSGNQLNSNPPDKIVVGFNPLDTYGRPASSAASVLDNLLGPLDVEGTNGITGIGDTDLQVYDQGTMNSEEYVVTANEVLRAGLFPITYHFLGFFNFPGFVELYTTNAGNSIFVRSTAPYVTTTVNAGSGQSSILVGELVLPFPFPPLYSLDAIQGSLTINGGGGTDSLALNDDGTTSGYAYDFSDQKTMQRQLGMVPIAAIAFSQMATLDLYQAAADDTTYVYGTAPGTTVTVHTGDGTDILNAVSLDQIQGPLDFVWSTGFKELSVMDTSAMGEDTYTIDPLELDRTGAPKITWNHDVGVVALAVGMSPAELVYIPTIDAGTQMTVFGEAGPDTIMVATNGQGQSQDLTAIQGALTIMGGANTSLDLEDQQAATGRVYTVGGIEFQAAVNSTSQPPPFCTIQYHQLSNLTLDSGNLGNVTNVTGTAQSTTVIINAGTNDAITVADVKNSLAGIQGPLALVGIGSNNQASLVDTGGTSGTTYMMNPTYLMRSAMPNVPIGYQHLASLALEGSPSGDTYEVEGPIPVAQAFITASGLGNMLVGPNTNSIWSINGANAGKLNGNINFTSIESLQGGAGSDLFVIQTGGSLTGTLNGGSGTNSLSYSQYLNDVTVNLLLGTATGIVGGINQIQNVTGSMGNSLIVGDANPNVLIGGTGRNVIIGGAGADTLDASAATSDNILIGGTTDFDSNQVDLNAIFAEWTRTDLNYHDRFSDLNSGGNPGELNVVNGQEILLNKSTVHADLSPDTLTGTNQIDPMTGKRAHNWFFFDIDDAIVNFLSSSDHKTLTK
jgi:hypothetical protein